MTSSLSRCPIEDVLPWTSSTQQQQQQQPSVSVSSFRGSNNNSTSAGASARGSNIVAKSATILVPDRVETSGRFLFFVTAAHALRSRNPVLWLSFNGAYTEDSIRQGLKKIGYTLATATTAASNNRHLHQHVTQIDEEKKQQQQQQQQCTIKVIAHEIAEKLSQQAGSDEESNFDAEEYIRGLYRCVKQWIGQPSSSECEKCVILLDDVSALADLVGHKLAYAFAYQVKAAVTCQERTNINLLIRCAGDGWEAGPPEAYVGDVGKVATSGGVSHTTSLPLATWESSLLELSDWIVDVLPLQSGYLREAHGRLLVTSRQDMAHTPIRYNYCLTDQAVYAIRLTPQRYR